MGFSPPSDFIDDAPRSHWGRNLLLGGLGCLLLLLAVGGVLTYGTCRTGKQCFDAAEEKLEAELAPVNAMLSALEKNQDQTAYDALGDSYREANSFESFQAMVNAQGDLLRGGQPRLVGSRSTGRARREGYFLIVQIFDGDTDKGVVTFQMTRPSRDASPVIDDILIGMPAARLEQEAISRMLQRHVDHLGRGQFTEAWSDLGGADGDAPMDQAAFETFIKANGDLFLGGRVEVIELDGKDRDAVALVRVLAPDASVKGQVRYQLQRHRDGQWRILAMSTVEGDDPAGDDPQEGLEAPQTPPQEGDDVPDGSP